MIIIKSENVKCGLKLAFTYTGVVIGAGFASGKELECFFLRYGFCSIIGLISACILFAIFFNCALSKILKNHPSSMSEYFNGYYSSFTKILEIIIHLFMISSYAIMISASGALFNQQFGWPIQIGTFGLVFLSFLVLITESRNILILNSIMVPILILGIIFTLLCQNFEFSSISTFFSLHKLHYNWGVSALVYVGYNIITVPVIFMALKDEISNIKTIKIASITSFFFLSIPAIAIWQLLYRNHSLIERLQIPILGVISNDNFTQIVYTLVLFIAIFAHAITNGLAINQQMIQFLGIKKFWCTLILSVVALIMSIFPFSVLIEKLYTTFGYIGILLFFLNVFDNR